MKLTDNISIYSLLEKTNNLPTDFSSDQLITFDHNDDFFTIFYTAGNRSFTAYTAPGFMQRPDALPELLQTIQDAPEIPDDLRNAAISLIEDRMHSQNNNRFFFDAH